MATPTELQGLYLGMLGRVADADGFGFWNTPPRSNQTISQLALEFAKSSEYKQRVAGLTIERRIDQIYQQLLGRERDALEIFWVNEVKGNRVAIERVALLIYQGVLTQSPTSTDRIALMARLEFANQFTEALRVDPIASARYIGPEAAAFAAESLNRVRGLESAPTTAQVQQMVSFLGRQDPLLGSLNLSLDPSKPKVEQLQTEISTTVTIGLKTYGVSSGGGPTLQLTDLTNPALPVLIQRVPIPGYTSQSVASFGTLVAVALSPGDYATNGGQGVVRFFQMQQNGSLRFLKDVQVGYLPDSLEFSEDGLKVLVANEGEPTSGYAIDNPGTIGIISIGVSFGRFDFTYTDLGFANVPLPPGIRLSGPVGTLKANDIEPEYVTIFGGYGYVTLQENNGVAKVNLQTKQIEKVFASGAVDFFNQLVDLSDKDGSGGTPVFAPKLGQPFEGLRQADGIAAYQAKGQTWFVTANEGDPRDYGIYIDEIRGSGLDRVKRLVDDANVGSSDRITTFGGRSASIFNAETGILVWNSGNTLQTVAAAAGVYDDTRSDDKGVEPEGIVIAELNGKTYAIVGLERTTKSMLVVFDVTNPNAASFVTSLVINNSVSPEGLYIVEAAQSPTGRKMLVVSNEITNTLDLVDLELLVKAAPAAGAGTFLPTMLKDVAGGPDLKLTSLITIGEFTNGLKAGDPVFTPVGVPDGMGAYDNQDGTFTVLVNAEIGPGRGYGFSVGGLNPVVDGARISKYIVDKDVDDDSRNGFQPKVLAGGLAYNQVISPDPNFFKGSMNRFCGANLIKAGAFEGRGFVNTIYLMGEESSPGGRAFALDPTGEKLYHVPAFGYGGWESMTAVDTGSANTVGVMLFDDANAPLYLWVGSKLAGSTDFLAANGIAASSGVLYAWKADGIAPTPAGLGAVALNTPVVGEWVKLGTGTEIAALPDAAALRTLAFGKGAMQFTRIEDGDVSPITGKQVAFNSTGGSAPDLYGSTYIADLAQAFGADGLLKTGLSTSLRVLVDSDKLTGLDRQNGVRNQDNLAWGTDNFIYVQEDRSLAAGTADGQFGSQEASIWKVDSVTGAATRWSQIDRTAVPTLYGQTDSLPLDGGNWESSGLIDLRDIYGGSPGSYFLGNVQAHSITNGNIYGAPYLAEGGQIIFYQPSVPLL